MTLHESTLEVTHCDTCQTELEEGQVGLCEGCLPERTFTFAELSESAKDEARDALRYSDYYLHDEWWDSVYEDAARIAAILGIDITDTRKTKSGRLVSDPAINFSGFSSQGDGACFRGSYTFNPKAVGEMAAYCNDAELLRIATELHALQLARRLLGLAPFSAEITRGPGSNYYSHSSTMSVDLHFDEDEEEPTDTVNEVTQLMRDFADWIYESLEAEHDHLMSDDVVDEQLAEETFDEFGNSV